MSLVRPEVRAALLRWREALIGLAVIALGLWWGLGPAGLLRWIGLVVVAAGVALTFAGMQRGRFRNAGGGAGVVQVTEGQIAYFGPETGGVVAADLLREIEVETAEDGSQSWILHHEGGPELAIPVNAAGAEALLDVFAALPGLGPSRLLSMREAQQPGRLTVWSRQQAARLTLH